MSSRLSTLLTRHVVANLATGASFERGLDYFNRGKVVRLIEHGNTVTAKVSGTAVYEVRLSAVADGLEFNCSCPVGGGGDFCKHCVAVALAWLENRSRKTHGGEGSVEDPAPLVTLDDLRPWLLKQPPETLADLLLSAAEHDVSKGIDFAAYRASITRATATPGFVSYHEAYGFACGVREAITPLEELLAGGYADEVVKLAEHALKRVEKALGETDDSDGGLGGVLEHLQDIHLKACLAAKPDPEVLVERLFDWEIHGDGDVFYGAVEKYATVLGEKGRARYRALAKELWNRLPALKPGAKEDFTNARFHLTHIMEQLARAEGSLDALVKIKAKDLSDPFHFLEIARLYAEAGRSDDALAWAEQGMSAFRDKPDRALREFTAEEYHQRGRHTDAIALMWAQFKECPCLGDYQKLETHADRASAWPEWRPRALEKLQPNSKAPSGKVRGVRDRISRTEPDASELVKVYLWEGDTEAAWREAKQWGCERRLWITLANERENDHPEDAIPIYQQEAERLVEQKNNSSYEEAVGFLARVKKLMSKMDQETRWPSYIAEIRTRHKPKRNFITMAARLD